MPALPDVQKPAGKQNIFPKIPGARSANLIHPHEILHKQYLGATTALLVSTPPKWRKLRTCMSYKALQACKPTDQIRSLSVSCNSHTALNLLGSN